MPKDRLVVNEPRDLTLETFRDVIFELNQVLAKIEERLDVGEGLDGRSPKLNSDLDMNDHEIVNVKSIELTGIAGAEVLQDVLAAAIVDPADTPASADALRDDLVANTIPSIQSIVNDLTTGVNAALARLRLLSGE